MNTSTAFTSAKTFITMILLANIIFAQAIFAQHKDFSYRFFGEFRNDVFYNSRQSYEGMDGAFYNYPKERVLDPNGKDLNAVSSAYFYNANTHFGVSMTGPNLGKAKTEAVIELDMRGNMSDIYLVRMKQAFINFDWGKHSLLVGQSFNIIAKAVFTEVLNINSGAPFQPRGLAPQITYQFQNKNFLIRASAQWQSLMQSMGPNGKSREYLKNSKIPELATSLDFKVDGFRFGVAAHFSSLVPRLKSETGYKVRERINALSMDAHASYRDKMLYVAARSMLSQNLTQMATVGGYGITATDAQTGENKYKPLRFSQSWLNVMYGKKWRGGVFAGFIKNIGATKDVTNLIGVGTNIDKMVTSSGQLTYRIQSWKFGAEYTMTKAWFGDPDNRGRAINTYNVTNHRLCLSVKFAF